MERNEDYEWTFVIDKSLREWVKEHNKHCHSGGTAGEHWKFEIIPTGIVEIQTVKCICCGEEKTAYL